MNYYDVLRVDKSASSKEIKESYKKLIKRYHPDLYPGNKIKAETITRDLNEAYEVLSDPEKRAMYDASLEEPQEIKYTPPTPEYTYRPKTNIKSYTTMQTEDEGPNFEEKLRENIHKFVNKHSENMTPRKKIATLILVTLGVIIILLLTAKDYIDFNSSMKEKQRKEELNAIYENYTIDEIEEYLENQNYIK